MVKKMSFSEVCKMVIYGEIFVDVCCNVVDETFIEARYQDEKEKGLDIEYKKFKGIYYEEIEIENMGFINCNKYILTSNGNIDLTDFNKIFESLTNGELFFDYEYDRIVREDIPQYQYKKLYGKDFTQDKEEYEKFLERNFDKLIVFDAKRLYDIGFVDYIEILDDGRKRFDKVLI